MKILFALMLPLLIASCATPPSSACSWVRQIRPSAGFEQRWTTPEKRQVVAHNRKVKEFCR